MNIQKYPYIGNVEENENVNFCVFFAFKYIYWSSFFNEMPSLSIVYDEKFYSSLFPCRIFCLYSSP